MREENRKESKILYIEATHVKMMTEKLLFGSVIHQVAQCESDTCVGAYGVACNAHMHNS